MSNQLYIHRYVGECNELYRAIRSQLTNLALDQHVNIMEPDADSRFRDRVFVLSGLPRMLLYTAILEHDFKYADWIIDTNGLSVVEAEDGGDTTILRYMLNDVDDEAITAYVLHHPTFESGLEQSDEALEDWEEYMTDAMRRKWVLGRYSPLIRRFQGFERNQLVDYNLIREIQKYLRRS